MWYTLSMNANDQPHIPEQTEGCPDANAIEHAQACTRALRLVGDVWTLMIVHNLLSGSKRFGELLEALGNVSPKTVSQRLKMLEVVGIVERQAYAEIPPRVEYRLTEKGRALIDVVKAIEEYGTRYLIEDEPAP